MLLLPNFRRYASKRILQEVAPSHRNRYSQHSWLLFKNISTYSSVNLMQDVNQIKAGQKFFQERNLEGAQEMFEAALNIVPFYIQDNSQFNIQFDSFLEQLIKTYAWRGKVMNIQNLVNRIITEQNEKKVSAGQEMKNILQVLSIAGKGSVQLSPERQLIMKLYKTGQTKSKQPNFKIQKELSFQDKTAQINSVSLDSWIHGELRNTWTFVLLSLLSTNNISSNENYNKLCSTLLKNTERASQKNIIKPLLLLITNLLRKEQYLQAEGMISYCLDRKKQNLKAELLKSNQQYILLNILLGKTFNGVKRETEGMKLLSDYRRLFDLQTLVLQGYLLDSI